MGIIDYLEALCELRWAISPWQPLSPQAGAIGRGAISLSTAAGPHDPGS